MSYLRDGIDAVDRLQREAYKERKIKEDNSSLRKLRKAVQGDEQTAINRYSEGFCYGCAKKDKIISTLVYVCMECMEKRGSEGLMCIVIKKHNWELCDICGTWQFDDVYQVNLNFCDSCMTRLNRIHKAYKKSGGRKSAPDEKRKRKYYGKNINEQLGSGVTRDQTREQKYSRA
jgi:hypothetical protein